MNSKAYCKLNYVFIKTLKSYLLQTALKSLQVEMKQRSNERGSFLENARGLPSRCINKWKEKVIGAKMVQMISKQKNDLILNEFSPRDASKKYLVQKSLPQ